LLEVERLWARSDVVNHDDELLDILAQWTRSLQFGPIAKRSPKRVNGRIGFGVDFSRVLKL
jgi:hypothetical protein